MKINYVTFTGIDESVKLNDLVLLQEQYPKIKIEYAILISKTLSGKTARYPSLEWIYQALKIPNLYSGHLVGSYLVDFCRGINVLANLGLWNNFHRIQLNFHGIKRKITDDFYNLLTKPTIFQMENTNEELYYKALDLGKDVYPLFDSSCGNGILPKTYRNPIHARLNGYAGGLSADNINNELKKIENIVQDGNIWIDMETSLRSGEESNFDIEKCKKVLDKIGENYV